MSRRALQQDGRVWLYKPPWRSTCQHAPPVGIRAYMYRTLRTRAFHPYGSNTFVHSQLLHLSYLSPCADSKNISISTKTARESDLRNPFHATRLRAVNSVQMCNDEQGNIFFETRRNRQLSQELRGGRLRAPIPYMLRLPFWLILEPNLASSLKVAAGIRHHMYTLYIDLLGGRDRTRPCPMLSQRRID